MADNQGSAGTPNFRADRLNAGESVETRAARMGIHRRTLDTIESRPGVRPSPRVAKAVADFYGRTVVDMWPLSEPEQAAA